MGTRPTNTRCTLRRRRPTEDDESGQGIDRRPDSLTGARGSKRGDFSFSHPTVTFFSVHVHLLLHISPVNRSHGLGQRNGAGAMLFYVPHFTEDEKSEHIPCFFLKKKEKKRKQQRDAYDSPLFPHFHAGRPQPLHVPRPISPTSSVSASSITRFASCRRPVLPSTSAIHPRLPVSIVHRSSPLP